MSRIKHMLLSQERKLRLRENNCPYIVAGSGLVWRVIFFIFFYFQHLNNTDTTYLEIALDPTD